MYGRVAKQRRCAVQRSDPAPADMQKATEALQVCSFVVEPPEASCQACAVQNCLQGVQQQCRQLLPPANFGLSNVTQS